MMPSRYRVPPIPMLLVIAGSFMLCALRPCAARAAEGVDVSGLWGRTKNLSAIVTRNAAVRVGLNIGATAPYGIPKGVGIISYAPIFASIFGFEKELYFAPRWFANVGLQLEYKGMRTRSEVHDFYTEVVQDDGQNVARVAGIFTGENVTRVSRSYITMPLHLGFVVGPHLLLKAGGYASFSLGQSFTGSVENGFLWTKPDPATGVSNKIFIERAEFNFSSKLRRWDFGVEAVATMILSDHLFMDLGLAFGVHEAFSSRFTALPFKMYNIYASFCVGYRFSPLGKDDTQAK